MILILGANGYIGRRYTLFFKEKKLEVISLSRSEVDYTQPALLRKYVRQLRPDFLINAAGFTGKPNVDACEKAKAETLAGNTVLPLRIAEICGEENIAWGHISSGCIYQGNRGLDSIGQPLGFREDDIPNFTFHSVRCSFYSGTKALTEEILRQNAPNAYIWRMRIPFDYRDAARNYLSKVLRYDQLLNVRNSLSNLDDFVAASWATMERNLPLGIYNMTNPGSMTTSEVVDLIRHEGEARMAKSDAFSAGRMLKKFTYFESEEEFMKFSALAPRSSCVLDTTKAEQLGLPLRPVREAITDSLKRWMWEK
jgi:dTDP-4-dehydrorhamnose reductase